MWQTTPVSLNVNLVSNVLLIFAIISNHFSETKSRKLCQMPSQAAMLTFWKAELSTIIQESQHTDIIILTNQLPIIFLMEYVVTAANGKEYIIHIILLPK